MKIVSIVWYKVLPPKFGGQKGIACFNEQLAQHHPLVCLCAASNEPADDLSYKVIPDLPVSKWQFILPSCWKKIKDIVSQEKATHLILEHPYHGIAAVKTCKRTGAKLIVHSHNIESERFRQMGKWWWRILFLYEKWVHRKAHLGLFKTDQDMQWAIDHFKLKRETCMVMPYGVTKPIKNKEAGLLIRQRHGIAATDKILLFTGTLDYKPNAIAVEYIFNQIVPELSRQSLSYRIIICGRNQHPDFRYLGKLSHPAVILAGEVEDIENYFSAADVFINPVNYGGGVQTKNLDALSYGLNIVAFKKMADNKLKEVCFEKLFLAEEDTASFICQIVMAFIEKKETPSAFFDTYNWESAIAEFLKKLTQPVVLNKV